MVGALCPKVASPLSHISWLFPVFLVSVVGFSPPSRGGWLVSLVPEGIQPRLLRDEALGTGTGVVLGTGRPSFLIAAAPATGLATPGVVLLGGVVGVRLVVCGGWGRGGLLVTPVANRALVGA